MKLLNFIFIIKLIAQSNIFTLILLYNKIKTNHVSELTGSVKVESWPPERKVVSSSHSRVIPKT